MGKDSKSQNTVGGELKYHTDLRIPVKGETVAATRIEPTGFEGPLPAIVMVFPYHTDDYGLYGKYIPSLEYFAKQGYEVVSADLPGTGASTGQKTEPFTPDEGPQSAAIVEWVAEQEWTTGKVGMYGKSWGGQTQLRAASEDPDGLEAIVPIMPATDIYEDVAYTGGVMESYKAACGFPIWYQTLKALPPTRRNPDGEWADIWDEKLSELKDGTPWLFQLQDHPTKDEYWTEKVIPTDDISTPMLMVAGYRDLHPVCDIECFEAAKGPKRMLLGPWRHTMPHRGREVAINFREQVVEWFDKYLKGLETGVDEKPTISYWTEMEGGGTIEGGAWRECDEWPTAQSAADSLSFTLTESGLTQEPEFEDEGMEVQYTVDHTVGVQSLDYLTDQPLDPAEDNNRSLMFKTEPLSDAVEFTGTGEATLTIRAETPDPTIAVRVIDIDPEGRSSVVSHGYLNASHRENHSSPQPLAPGEVCELEIELKPRSHVFAPGHRIAVAVSGELFPMTFPSASHGSFTVLSSADAQSEIRFPGRVHADEAMFEDTHSMPSPDTDAVPVSSPYLTGASNSWRTSREHTTDDVSFETDEEITIELPHGPVLSWKQSAEATTNKTDPAQTMISATVNAEVEFENEITTVETRGRITQQTAQLTTIVKTDGEIVFEETWSRPGGA